MYVTPPDKSVPKLMEVTPEMLAAGEDYLDLIFGDRYNPIHEERLTALFTAMFLAGPSRP